MVGNKPVLLLNKPGLERPTDSYMTSIDAHATNRVPTGQNLAPATLLLIIFMGRLRERRTKAVLPLSFHANNGCPIFFRFSIPDGLGIPNNIIDLSISSQFRF